MCFNGVICHSMFLLKEPVYQRLRYYLSNNIIVFQYPIKVAMYPVECLLKALNDCELFYTCILKTHQKVSDSEFQFL